MGTPTLNATQLGTYRTDGYIVLPAVFGPHEIAEMRAEADRLVELTFNASLATGERSPRLDLTRRDGRVVLRKIQPISDVSMIFERYARDERLIAPQREILGCDPVMIEEKLNYKQLLPDADIEPSPFGEAFDYHTDYAYFRLNAYPRETLSSAISLDDSTPDNGPLRVLPGSHLRDWPTGPDHDPVIPPEAVPDQAMVDVLAPAGSVMVFHSCLVHSSAANRTDGPRRIMIFSHIPSTHQAEPDVRNRHLREEGRAHEDRYRALVASGTYADTYRVS